MVDVLAGKKAYFTAGSTTGRYLRTIATESAGDPRVGMIGGSYGGQIQYAVAKQDPRIDAIIPIITWNDLNYSLAPGRVAKKQWVDLFFGAGIVSGVGNANEDPETMTGCAELHRPGVRRRRQPEHAGYADPDTEALARHASVASYVKQVKAPDPAGAGPEGHPVQPQRGRRDVRLAEGAGHPGEDGLAVLGPLRLRPGRRRARLRRLVAARLLPRQPVPELDEPLRARPEHGHDRPAVRVLP